MKQFKIEKDIPITRAITGAKYPFSEMEDGDSFIAGDYSKKLRGDISAKFRSWKNKQDEHWKISTRKTENSKLRVWLIKIEKL